MSRLLSLRIRAPLFVAVVLLGLLAATFTFVNDFGTAVRSADSAERLVEIDTRVRRALGAVTTESLSGLQSRTADPLVVEQIESASPTGFLGRLSIEAKLAQAWVTDEDGRTIGHVGDRPLEVSSQALARLATRAAIDGSATGIIGDSAGTYLVAALRVPTTTGARVVIAGRAVDDSLARDLNGLTGLEITLFKLRSDGSTQRLGHQTSALTGARFHDGLNRLDAEQLAAGVTLSLPDVQPGRAARLGQPSDLPVYFAAVPSGPAVAARLDGLSVRLMGAIGVVSLLLLLGAWLFTRRIADGLQSMIGTSRQLAHGKYETSVRVRGNDELVRFAETFNVLAQSLKLRETKIFQAANRDSATGLPTRALFENKLVEMMGRARARKKPMGLVVVVVDRLREVNDSLGRKAGDAMLAEVAQRLRKCLRGSKRKGDDDRTFVARLATYEFGIILDDTDAAGAAAVAKRLAEALDRRLEFDGQSVSVGARFGVATYPDHGIDAGGLMSSADIAASNAAAELTRIAMFDPSFERDRERQLGMLQELRRALSENELYIALLPKVSLQSDGPLMAEALMRWEHPERGPLNPGEFIPFAEKTGFITQLTNWMIEAALQVAADWHARGEPLNISVNISPRDIGSPDFPTFVVERLRAHNLRGHVLTLEVTESAVLQADPVVRQNLDVLWRLGVKIALDDFGAGFGALDELRALPLSYVMIDRHVIRGLTSDDASRIVVQAAIDIGHCLGVEVVAEGVEAAEQFEALRRMGCDQVQGFFVGKPLTDDQFRRWVSDRNDHLARSGAAAADVPALPALGTIEDLAAEINGHEDTEAGVLMIDDLEIDTAGADDTQDVSDSADGLSLEVRGTDASV